MKREIKRVLILGNGYVGGMIFNHFRDRSVIYDKASQLLGGDGFAVYLKSRKDLDYHSRSALTQFINSHDIDIVINCAGFTGRPNVDECELKKWDCWNLNVVVPYSINTVCNETDTEYIHISSGCVYSGYNKDWGENDSPNFGLDATSSFYSKSKHAFEEVSNNCCVVRVRMPFDDTLSDRSYITKILKYDNLINYVNSKTYIPDLCRFIVDELILTSNNIRMSDIGILNFVNPDPLVTSDITSILDEYGDIKNNNWKFVPIDGIDITAPRSNCILDTSKLYKMFPNFEINSEKDAMIKACNNIKTSS